MTFSSHRRYLSLLLLIALLLPAVASAVDLLTTAETFFDENDDTRVGIEVEFMKISPEEARDATLKAIGGEAVLKEEEKITTIKGYDAEGKPLYNTVKTPYYEITGSSVDGKVILKIENNQIDDFNMAKVDDVTIELVTDPISGLPQVQEVQKVMDELKARGAEGTSEKNAVSTQINQEVSKGNKAKLSVENEVNNMRAYTSDNHRPQIAERLGVPKVRQPYVISYSKGFLAKLRDPQYRPKSWRELYDDYIYRQSLELMGDKNAWTMPIEQARAKLLAKKNPIVPSVAKQNLLRVSSLLAYMVPDDPMSREMIDSGWIKPYPIREYREMNNVFDVVTPYKQVLGLNKMVEKYGNFDHDSLMAELSGLEKSEIQKLRQEMFKSRKTGKPYTWRYFLADPRADIERGEYEAHKKARYRKKDTVGFLSPSETGVKPLVLPGESVVMHRRPIHAKNIVGKYNPGLYNANIAQALENKYTEAKFLEEFAPGTMPRTLLLDQVIDDAENVTEALAKLNKEFPNGWIIKGVWDLGTEGMLLTDKMDLVNEIQKYRESDFDQFKVELDKDPQWKTMAPEHYQKALSDHPGYQGWRMSESLKRAKTSIVQARMDIASEFRVEVIGGRVLGKGSTIDRYAYKNDYKSARPAPSLVKKVEAYVQAIVDKLPPELRSTPFAFDIAVQKDGSLAVVETNPGSNSSFLYEEDWKPSIKALSQELEQFPERVKRGEVLPGLTPEAQMAWLEDHFDKWGISKSQLYEGITFTKAELLDEEFPPRKVERKNFRLDTSGKLSCPVMFVNLGAVAP